MNPDESAGAWPCHFCSTWVDIPMEVAMQMFDGDGWHAIRAEQARHLRECSAYLDVLGARFVAHMEAALREAVS